MLEDSDRTPDASSDDLTGDDPAESGSGDEFPQIGARDVSGNGSAETPGAARLDPATTQTLPPPAPRKKTRPRSASSSAKLPKRGDGEDIFAYMHRADVEPHIVAVSLRQLRPDKTMAAAVEFDGTPTIGEVVAHELIDPGPYFVQLYAAKPSGGREFATSDRRYFLDARLFKKASSDDAAAPTPTPAPVPPSGSAAELVRYLRDDLEKARAAADLERQERQRERADFQQQMSDLRAEIVNASRQPQQNDTLEIARMLASPGTVDHAKLRAEYQGGFEAGERAGIDKGRVQQMREARKVAREELRTQIAQLQSVAKRVDERRGTLEDWEADLRRREIAVERREAYLDAREAQPRQAAPPPSAPQSHPSSDRVAGTDPSVMADVNNLMAGFGNLMGGFGFPAAPGDDSEEYEYGEDDGDDGPFDDGPFDEGDDDAAGEDESADE